MEENRKTGEWSKEDERYMQKMLAMSLPKQLKSVQQK